jgi:hypothetical protein
MFATRMQSVLVAGGLALSLAGFGSFAGVAAADPETCWGGIGPGSDHQPFAVGGAADEGCVLEHDTSDMSMTDIDEVGTWGMVDIAEAGSNPGHNAAFTAKPQTIVP